MDSRSRATFLALIVAQAAHSIEEYVFRLFDVLAPARFMSGLLSSDLARGFAIANIALVLFGVWCYVARVATAPLLLGISVYLITRLAAAPASHGQRSR